MSATKPLYARVPTAAHAFVHAETPDTMTAGRFAGVLLELGIQAWKEAQTAEKGRNTGPSRVPSKD